MITEPIRTAFPGTERHLRAALAEVPLDADSFRRPLLPCLLDRCGGTCCSEGVSLNAEEALVLRQITRRRETHLREWVPDLPEVSIVEEDGVSRTARKARPRRAVIVDYPDHFPEAACAFLTNDFRCALQNLAEAEGKHPWTYKPLACWLHPISLSPDAIFLPSAETDPYPGGFASQTHCGRTEPCGRPAAEVLRPELEFLGAVLGRDLLRDAADAGGGSGAPGRPS